ncbi:MAG: maltose alpha-D-glucosyltransferase [Actinobacteria bacterium HGW-Actinobacteria-4]|nr:MAG: maltose alpha-D-glucosyltransferase [Actinobacteria bacterium HGW-Actinobacteria-4]
MNILKNLPKRERNLMTDPLWYRTAVFYEVMVRAFHDSDGDGIGDLRGLIKRLDYLAWLGVDALWLPPIYPSPLRDGGYDVADYRAIDPRYGTMADFEELIAEVHKRGMRITIDLVMNHSSDQHPWFQASRTDPDGPYGDYYVWSDTDQKWANARIIFTDHETSNWAWDSVREQFYWHRFYHHQPDLNFENPKVQQEMMDIARFWLEKGIDGFRLDAVPYLFEDDSNGGENDPRTHEYLRRFRAMVDAEFPGRVLLAEANQPPEEAAAYFGTEEEPECHLCFHFPVMPRIFYSIKAQDATKLREILHATPVPPAKGQWSTFLRNHDELTLEMVTDQERRQMFEWYAPHPQMKANVGIRRRLAPLLDNSRHAMELAHALILSLPGTPCLYYGDEIGMGDNVWLPDRDGVRTPMQWTPDRNAGFSRADPGALNLPVVQSLLHHYNGVNVESSLMQPTSLLFWLRRFLTSRAQHPAFADGGYADVPSSESSVFSFLRTHPEESVLVAMNFSTNQCSTLLDLPDFAGRTVKTIVSNTPFQDVGDDGKLRLTFGPHSFYWLVIAHD